MIFVWTLSDVLWLAFVAVLVLAWVWFQIGWMIRRCKHDGRIGENSACDAICGKCGQNLGFIGAWRERQSVPSTNSTQGKE